MYFQNSVGGNVEVEELLKILYLFKIIFSGI